MGFLAACHAPPDCVVCVLHRVDLREVFLVTYTVLARRYRSQDFDEVIGQSAIADTLQRAVEGDRAAHAYLFTGTRGVGKTTMARIFARAMNVTDGLTDAKPIADAIMRGDDLDVIEIDGASNRGVQEARDLIAGAGLSPARCPYRIYIIDEVHMLTTESFNTLLKTMEEPPEHVKFILCTTEPQKVLATIQSRCQRFDFKPIPRRLILEHLRSIVAQEGVEMDDAALGRVAELGNGSMRDALSVMDRVLAGGDTVVSLEALEEMLGLPEAGLINAVVNGLADGDPKAALEAADQLLAGGTSIDQALQAFTELFRQMLLIRTCGPDTEVLDLTEDARVVLAAQAEQFDPPSLVHGIAVCEAAARQGRLGASARAVFDAALVRLALAADLISPAAIAAPVSGGGGAKKKRAVVPPKKSPPMKVAPEPIAKKKPAASKPAASKPAASKPAAPKPAASTPAAASASTRRSSMESLEQVWDRLVKTAKSQVAKATFEGVEPVRFDGDSMVVRSTGAPIPRGLLERLAKRVSDAAGRGVKVNAETPMPATPTRRQSGTSTEVDDPRVDLAKELFEASVVDVRKHEQQEEHDV
jgi:DNA polymerase-3 subunit gamma/tau